MEDKCTSNIPYPYKIELLDKDLNDELLKDFLGEPDGFYKIGPKEYVFPSNMKDLAEKYYNFQARSDDIWLVTFPKSGTTWSQELIWLINNNLDYETAKSVNLVKRSIFFEYDIILHPKILKKFHDENIDNPEILEILKNIQISKLDMLEELTTQRIIKTHFPLSMVPPSVFEKNCKIIYIARNSLDVAVSYYHHCRFLKTHDFQQDFSKFWEYFKKNLILWCPHIPHVLEAWEQKDNPNLLFLFYENMIKDLPSNIKNIAKFLNKTISDEDLPKLCDHLHIKNFKNNPSVNYKTIMKGGLVNENEQEFIRKGKVLENDEFTKEMKEDALKWMEEQLEGTDFKFPIM